MSNLKILLLAAAGAMSSFAAANAETVTMHTPESFQVLSMSPNGKWACGVYVDENMVTYGFRWNLEGGSIEMLGKDACTAYGIANDGTVSGDFPDKLALANGAPVTMPGYWRDGAWHHLEMPKGNLQDGIGYGISPDGRSMTGSVCVDGIYNAYIWKDGRLHRDLSGSNHGVGFAVTPDGEGATGFYTTKNRTASFWQPDGKLQLFTDSPDYSYSPWNYGRGFSPDGKYLVYWGGWEQISDSEIYLYALYNTVTGEKTKVKSPALESDLEFFNVTNNGMLVGFDRGRGYVYANGEGMVIDDYLKLRGADLSGFDDFYAGTDYYVDQLPIFRVVAVSEDENCFALSYYNTRGQVSSMVVKLDQDLTKVAPAEVSAAQLADINTVQIKWLRPVGVNNIRGYNVYRDGKKINGLMPVNVPYYYDKNVAEGTYSYEVAAVNTAGDETKAEAVTVQVAAPAPQQPYALFARQKGVNTGYLSWAAPMAAGAHKRYYNPESEEIEPLAINIPVEVEMAIAFDKAELSNYSGFEISEVSFMPMGEQNAWKVNLYTRDSNGSLELLASQPVTGELKYREINTVKLDTPVAIPNADLVVAVAVEVKEDSYEVLGAQHGKVTPGYSDLLRQTTEPDFMSTYQVSAESGYNITCMSWAIDLGLSNTNASAQPVDHYNIYNGDAALGATAGNTFQTEVLADGTYNLGVEAVYADGSVSPTAYVPLTIAEAYPAINDLNVEAAATAVKASWTAPVDNDITAVTYSTASTHYMGLKGLESNGYAIMAAADYPASMLKGFEGYEVSAFRFYPLADAIFTFMLYENDKLVCELEVPEFQLEKWNTVPVDEKVVINPNSKYRLVLDCFDPVPDVGIIAIDHDMPRAMVSDLYSVNNGENWNSLSTETGAMGNWMIGMDIVDPQAVDLPVDGYDVSIDGRVRNGAKLTETTYTYDFGKTDSHVHSMRVSVYYPAKAEAVNGKSVNFYLSSAGISDNMIADIHIARGDNYLVVEGDGVEAVALVSTNGAVAAKAEGNRVDITDLSAGVYVARITVNGKPVNKKINILR